VTEPVNPRAGAREAPELPLLIQGGMGVGVSGWRLARAVAVRGQAGTVSGTALAAVVARRLQDGDPGGHVRRALEALPLPGVAERVLDRYFVGGGVREGAPYRAVPRPTLAARAPFTELTVAANFVEVRLAKEGHDGIVGVNYLHKVRLPTPASLYGALLAGVDFVAMGAGIPRDIPAMINALAGHRSVTLRVGVSGEEPDRAELVFDPEALWEGAHPPQLRRPPFLAIVASSTLAAALAREPETRPDGFIVEGPVAGGHNAPPRGRLRLTEDGQPVYGPRDEVDLSAVAQLGLPYWVAGGYADPARVAEARAAGAAGVQVGTAFALCDESGMAPALKGALLEQIANGEATVVTDPIASPTGFPFKVAQLDGTLSDAATRSSRARRCDLGFLSEPVRRADGSIVYRCPAEPVEDYVTKGGEAADAQGRVCLCNALLATVDLGQRRAGVTEPPIVTAGDGLAGVAPLARGGRGYTAADVIDHVLGHAVERAGQPR
jgi:NAD(P)H-dependent flavin oxidoreductase YrpB (nitropropane dioxygenase family)